MNGVSFHSLNFSCRPNAKNVNHSVHFLRPFIFIRANATDSAGKTDCSDIRAAIRPPTKKRARVLAQNCS